MKINNREKIKNNPTMWIGLAVLVFGILLFFIWLSFEKIKESSKDIFSAKLALVASRAQVKEVESFKAKYASYLPNLQRVDGAIVSSQNPLGFIEFLEKSASESNIDLTISPMSFSQDLEFKTLSVQLVVRGGFDDIFTFLNKIESGAYLVSVQKLSVEYVEVLRGGSGSRLKIGRANITIKVLAK